MDTKKNTLEISFSRSVLRWLQTIDLSQTYANPRVDFASGFLVAEIVAHYIPTVSMHSFSNFVSTKMRRDNWNQLMQIFIKNQIPINQILVDEVIRRSKDGAVRLVEILYTHFTKRTPCHCKIGDISQTTTKPIKEETNVSTIQPPLLPKPPEPQPEMPPPAPNRQRFIGSSSTARSGQADLTPISFESASVVKSGPGFLQLRNSATPQIDNGEHKALDTAIDELSKEVSPEALTTFVSCLTDTEQLVQFLTHYQPDMIIHFLKIAAPKLAPEFGPLLIDFLIDLFIPRLAENPLPIDDLADFIFSVPSQDPFTHHILLYQLFQYTEPELQSTLLNAFITRETELSEALSTFYAQKIEELSQNDPPYLLPSALSKFLTFDRQQAIPLIRLFPPTGDVEKDVTLVKLYTQDTEASLEQIKEVVAHGNRAVAALVLNKICQANLLSTEGIASLMLQLPDPLELLSTPYSIEDKGTTYTISPLIETIDAIAIAEAMADQITQTQPDRIDKEILLLSALMTKMKEEDTQRWGQVFMKLHEYLYLAFCDENVCKDVSAVCLQFFKLLQSEVFTTFSVLFKGLNYVFPTNCAPVCKQVAADFLSKAAEISPNFSQTVLKLLMNFPPKTHPDLDRLIAALKKVRK